jgi:3-oxoacyl-[acyl-carrier protein] reductase
MSTLTGRVALVTGASQGLGAAIAKRLGACGAKVAINFHASHDRAHAVCDEINSSGGTAAVFQADVTDEEAVKRLVSEVVQRFGPVDILVVNATGPQPFLPIEEQSWKHCLDQLRFFVKSPLLLLQQVVADMKNHRYGRIIQIGSEVVEVGNAEFAHYVAAKAAQLGLTRSWAKELGQYGITVNLVAPGWIPVDRHLGVHHSVLEHYQATVPMRRQGVPHDVAAAVAFLASDEANFITGQKLSVNGGNTFE